MGCGRNIEVLWGRSCSNERGRPSRGGWSLPRCESRRIFLTSVAHSVVPSFSSNQVPKPCLPPAKPGRPPPDPNVADSLLETEITILLPPGFEGRDLEVTRIPNRDPVNSRSYAPTSFGSLSGSFEDVVVEAEVGFVGVSLLRRFSPPVLHCSHLSSPKVSAPI